MLQLEPMMTEIQNVFHTTGKKCKMKYKLQSNLNLRALVVSFGKSLISRTSLKSNLKHRSTSILRKE
jgi:hypothetical protein